MAEQWALLHIDQLMPHPPVPPKALGCLSLRGTPWGSFTVSPGDPQAKGKRTVFLEEGPKILWWEGTWQILKSFGKRNQKMGNIKDPRQVQGASLRNSTRDKVMRQRP